MERGTRRYMKYVMMENSAPMLELPVSMIMPYMRFVVRHVSGVRAVAQSESSPFNVVTPIATLQWEANTQVTHTCDTHTHTQQCTN